MKTQLLKMAGAGILCTYIGITHILSCINICRVLRSLFEHEAMRPSVQTLSEGPGKC